MDLPYSQEQLREATHELIGRNGLRSCYIRPLVYRGHGPMGLDPLDNPVEVDRSRCGSGAPTWARRARRNGVRAKVSSWRRISPDSLIPHAKAGGQYLNSVLAKIESKQGGYDEAILLDDQRPRLRGHRRERVRGARRQDRHPAADGQHPRRHQPQVGDHRSPRDLGHEVVERDMARAELTLADEVFLAGTAAELIPVREIDDIEIGPPGRDHPRRSSRSSTTPCTAATSATPSGSTWCRYHREA